MKDLTSMNLPESSPARGRPRTITRERIADAGIAIGLPQVTFTGVAAALGVSHMALYKHVPSLDELKHLIAEVIFDRWQIPLAPEKISAGLKVYMFDFVESVRELVKAHPGLTPYVIRRLASTPSMIAKIDRHQRHIAQAYGIELSQSRWLLATVAFNCLAAADTVYSVAGREPAVNAQRSAEEAEMEVELIDGMNALVIGTMNIHERNTTCPVQDGGQPKRKSSPRSRNMTTRLQL